MTKLVIQKLNEVFLKIYAEEYVLRELADYVTFDNPKASFKYGGTISLLDRRSNKIYVGLSKKIEQFCSNMNYECVYRYDPATVEFSDKEALDFIKTLNLPFEPRYYQLNAFVHAVRERRSLLLSPTSCHKAGDKVLMYDGFYKNIEDILIDDTVIGMDGLPKKVLKIFTGKDDIYEIKPRNNKSSIFVTKEHLLPLRFSDYNEKYGYSKGSKEHIENVIVDDYIKKANYYKHCSNLIYNNKEISFSNENIPECSLSPYFIGCYIGDGSSYSCQITTNDPEIVNVIYDEAFKLNMEVKNKVKMHYNIIGRVENSIQNKIFNEFRKIGLFFSGKNRIKCENRFIPQVLLNTPINYRMELLAGLIDTDGTLDDHTSFIYTSKSKILAENISLLGTSLGLITNIKIKSY